MAPEVDARSTARSSTRACRSAATGADAEGAARAAGLGRARAEPVGRLGALRAGAPFPPPATAVRVTSLGRQDLTRFDVVVLPAGHLHAGSWATTCSPPARTGSPTGGTLITMGEASRWACARACACSIHCTELARRHARIATPPPKPKAEPPKQPDDYDEAITPARSVRSRCRGHPPGGAGQRALAVGGHRWRGPGDGREPSRVQTVDAGQAAQRRASTPRRTASLASGLCGMSRRPAARRRRICCRPADGPRPRHRVRGGSERPRVRELTQLLFMNAVLLGPAQ